MRSGRRASSRRGLPTEAQINVTSLVDVAFTLLVIFIITAPILQGGIEVDLPEGNVAPLDADRTPIIVSIDRDGTFFVEDQRVETAESLRQLVQRLVERSGGGTVYLRGDRQVPYGRVIEAFDAVNQVEGAQLSVVVESDTRRR
ncbi:MAG: biopolymer transporter ExbD [Gemmatimonadota bacterium]|nr:biopolymer transporter ExbD [Gemmatimonadota bacterium]